MCRRFLRKLWRPFAASPPSLESASQLPETCEDIRIEIIGVQAPDRGYLQNAANNKAPLRQLPVVGVYDARSIENTIDQRWLERTLGEAVPGGLYIVTWKFEGRGCLYKSLHRAVHSEDRFQGSAVVLFYHNRSADVPLVSLSPFQDGLRQALQDQGIMRFTFRPKKQPSWNPLRQRTKHQHAGRNEGKRKLSCHFQPTGGSEFGVSGGPGLEDWEEIRHILLPGVAEARDAVINKPSSHLGDKSPFDGRKDLDINSESRLSHGDKTLPTRVPNLPKSDSQRGGEDAGQADLKPAVHSVLGDSSAGELVEGPRNCRSVAQPSLVIRPPSHDENQPVPPFGVSQPHQHNPDLISTSGGLEIRGHRRGQSSSQDSNGTTLRSCPSSYTRQTTLATSMSTDATTVSQPTIGGWSPTISTSQYPFASQHPRHPVPEKCDEREEESEFSPIGRVSTCSSSHSNRPFPDDYWTYDEDRKNYYHIDENEDGSKTTVWYPKEFM